jgi:hypothetical protein
VIFQICAPPYRKDSVGVRVLYQLCDELNRRGIPATAGLDIADHPPKVAVYPEVVEGNPFDAQIVARWLLSNRPCTISENDLVFVWEPWCNPPGHEHPQLRLPMIDESIFYDAGRERSGTCIYARKYLMDGGKIRPEHEDLLNLATLPAGYWKVIALMLQKAEKLVSYERSQITTEANLCGCPVEFANPGVTENYSAEIEMRDYQESKDRAPQMVSDFIAACVERADAL